MSLRRCYLLAAVAVVAACSGKDSSVGPTPNPGIDSTLTMMVRTPAAAPGARGGTTLRLDVLLRESGRTIGSTVQWSSTNASVATVDPTGLVTAQNVGEATIIADYGAEADSVAIRVIPVPVSSVTITGPDSLSLDDTVHYSATPRDSVGVELSLRSVGWTSSLSTVASISGDGDVIGRLEGTSRILATVDGTSASRDLRVWPQPVASIVVEPSSASIPQFHKVKLTVTLRDRRGKLITGRPITWGSTAPIIASVKAGSDSVVGRDIGDASVTATVDGKTGASAITVTAPVEARALWITRFDYTTSSAVDFAKIATIMSKAASANFNIVYFQVRTSGDALYYSTLEPCSPRMCGTLGGPAPAQDPLDVALTEAAKYGLQVHAWLNSYTGFISGSTAACSQFIASTPSNWLKAHPEWSVSTKNFTTGTITPQVDDCAGTSEYMWVSPGVPEVRTQLAQVAADIVRRYAPKGLKGIHLDRIRFPSNTVSYDSPSQEAFKAVYGAYPASNTEARWQDFRRGFVNQGVKAVFDSVRAVNTSMVLSAAVFPGYQPKTGWSAQWSFTDLFQDPQAWAQGGYLDVEVPMNYPATSTSTSWTVKAYCSNTDWTCVLDDHMQRIERGAGRHVYVGVGAIRGFDEMKLQLDLAHDRVATGVSVYSYGLVDAIPNGWALLAAGPFKNKASIPVMPWK